MIQKRNIRHEKEKHQDILVKLKFFLKTHSLPIFLFFLTFLLYLHNLSPSVYGGDVGDFLSAIAVRGVPHPSGYPLFTLLGIIFSYLPIQATLAYKVGLVSALFSSFSVVLMYAICNLLTRNKLISAITALTLAFTYIFWLYAEVAEVFALTYFFFILLTYLALLYYFKKTNKVLYILSFATGLSLANHEMILAIFPSLLILVLRTNWKVFISPRILLKCIFFLILGLTPYIYIPIAASFNPPINWDNAVNFNNFLHLVLRKDYGWGADQFKTYTRSLDLRIMGVWVYFTEIFELTIAGAILIFAGLFYLLKQKRLIVLISLVLAFFLTGPFFIYYGFTPQIQYFTMGVYERFYAISLLFLLPFFAYGLQLIINLLAKLLNLLKIDPKRSISYLLIFTVVFFSIPFSLFAFNFAKTNFSNVYSGDYLAEDLLAPLPKNSVVLLAEDSSILNSLYLQYANNFRKDVVIIGLGFAENNPVYAKELRRYREKNKKDPRGIVFTNIILNWLKERPVFASYVIGSLQPKNQNLEWVPHGLLLKLVNPEDKKNLEKNLLNNQQDLWSTFRYKNSKDLSPAEQRSKTLYSVQFAYYSAAVNNGNYILKNFSDFSRAKSYFEKAIKIAPNEAEAYKGLANFYIKSNQCVLANKILESALNINYWDKSTHLLIKNNYSECYKDAKKAEEIQQRINKLFKVKKDK